MASQSTPSLTPFQRRLLVTFGIVALYEVVCRFPFIRIETTGIIQPNKLQFFALGLMPIISGFTFIEILSFFIPPLSAWRRSGTNGRHKLTQWALIASFVAACLHGFEISHISGGLQIFEPAVLPGCSSTIQHLTVTSILVAGAFVLYCFILVLNKYGLTNGFVVVFFLSESTGLITNIIGSIKAFFCGPFPEITFDLKMNLFYLAIGFIIIISSIIKTIHSPKNPFRKYFWDRPTATYLIRNVNLSTETSPMPQTLNNGFGIFYMEALYLSAYNSLNVVKEYLGYLQSTYQLIDLLILSVFLWFLFTGTYWKTLQLEGRAHLPSKTKRSCDYFLFWLAIGCVLVFQTQIYDLIGFPNYQFRDSLHLIFDFTEWFVLIILGRELYENIKHYRENSTRECLLEMDNVEMAQLWTAQFKEANIPLHIEGLRYRQITQFFAPYLKMRVWVTPQYKEEALKIMDLDNLKQV
jgi:hypothetical protein